MDHLTPPPLPPWLSPGLVGYQTCTLHVWKGVLGIPRPGATFRPRPQLYLDLGLSPPDTSPCADFQAMPATGPVLPTPMFFWAPVPGTSGASGAPNVQPVFMPGAMGPAVPMGSTPTFAQAPGTLKLPLYASSFGRYRPLRHVHMWRAQGVRGVGQGIRRFQYCFEIWWSAPGSIHQATWTAQGQKWGVLFQGVHGATFLPP